MIEEQLIAGIAVLQCHITSRELVIVLLGIALMI
jgi:hypothetical protein